MFQSPFSERYGTDAMRRIWSQESKLLMWRRVWSVAAQAILRVEGESEEVIARVRTDLEQAASHAFPQESAKREAITKHDLVAELQLFMEELPEPERDLVHVGMTSSDVTDNVDVARQDRSLGLILAGLEAFTADLTIAAQEYRDLEIMGYTHLQKARPTTLGYRLAAFLPPLRTQRMQLLMLRRQMAGKGIKGPVGTYAGLVERGWSEQSIRWYESQVMFALGIGAWEATGQTYPRVQDYWLLSGLAGLAAILHKLALDLRLMKSEMIGLLEVPMSAGQVGSSAMPGKRNPINLEKVCSLCRLVAAYPQVAWDNAANTMLERTLDDSANRRVIVPEAFLAMDECLSTMRAEITSLDLAVVKTVAVPKMRGIGLAMELTMEQNR